MARLAAAVVALVALILTPRFFFYFDVTPKLLVLLLGVAVLLAGAGRKRRETADITSEPDLKLLSLLLFLTLLSLAVSTLHAANPALALSGTSWRRYGFVAQVALLLFTWLTALLVARDPARARTVLRGIALAAIAASLYGIAQYFGWDPLLPASAYHIGEGIWTIVRPPGTLGYAGYYAAWLLGAVFLGMALASLEPQPAWRWIARAAAALSLVALLMTGTRAADLGLLAGAAVWIWRRAGLPTQRIAIGVAVFAMLAAGFYFSPAGQQLRSRARWFAEDPWGGARIYLWRDSFRMALARPLAGYGPEVFSAGFPHFESTQLAMAYPDFSHESPHNMFLDALVAQGIPGLLLLGALCMAGLRAALRLPQAWPAAALVSMIVGHQFIVFTLPTALIFFTMIALAIGLASPKLEVRRTPSSPRRRLVVLSRLAVAAALTYAAVRYGVADHHLALVQRSLAAGNARAAAAEFAQYRRWRLPGAGAEVWYSRASMLLAQQTSRPLVRLEAISEARAAAVRATTTAERPFDAWYNLAAVYASQNDAAGAERSLRAAIAAHPNWFKPHWMLSQVLRLEGRLPEARQEAALAVTLDAGKHLELK